MVEEIQTLVIDCGSYWTKAGFAHDESPRSVFQTIVGYYTQPTNPILGHIKDVYIGDEIYERPSLYLKSPIDHGIITNWNEMEKILHYIFNNQLKVDPVDHPIIFSELVTNPKPNREKMLEIMFETFKVPSYYVGNQNAFAIYSTGRTTGVSCDIGHSVTSIVPIYEGCSIQGNSTCINLGGSDITNRLQELLKYHVYDFSSKDEKEIVRDIKEKCGYVSIDGKSSDFHSHSFYLPNGVIEMTDELYNCTEILFGYNGIDKYIFDSIMKIDINFRRDFYNAIVLSDEYKDVGSRIIHLKCLS